MNEATDVEKILSVAKKAEIFTKAEAATPEKTVDILVKAGVITPTPWWRSKGIWGSVSGMAGSLAILVAGIAKGFGWEVDIGTTELLLVAIFGAIAAFVTWLGRVQAVQPIDMSQVTPFYTLGGK